MTEKELRTLIRDSFSQDGCLKFKITVAEMEIFINNVIDVAHMVGHIPVEEIKEEK